MVACGGGAGGLRIPAGDSANKESFLMCVQGGGCWTRGALPPTGRASICLRQTPGCLSSRSGGKNSLDHGTIATFHPTGPHKKVSSDCSNYFVIKPRIALDGSFEKQRLPTRIAIGLRSDCDRIFLFH